MITKILGLLGGFCFGYCGCPAAYATVRSGKSVGTPISIAWMIFLGSIFMYSYLFRTYGFDWVLTFNYSIEAVSWGFIVYYHYFPRKQQIKLAKVSFEDLKGQASFMQDTIKK